ncbi:MAG: hypothetical protein A2W91_05680 [Bacteroidetes bacterium GWF2_38_335]|nr:MAG: hypothetical protein A2W91_05680 [Bacteroidetes bacterium GWF2_38_335]HBS88916.1 membrane protein insertion efficiency factor YidD [Bacteroidales bacterium]
MKSSGLIFLIIILSVSHLTAQNSVSDLQLLKNADFENKKFERKKTEWMFKDAPNGFVKYNPVSLMLGGMMFFYQSSISPQFFANCLYNPTCSEFSKKLVKRYGIFKGVFLTADRLTRCNSFSARNIAPGKKDRVSGKVNETPDIYKSKSKKSYTNR